MGLRIVCLLCFFLGGLVLKFRTHFLLEIELSPPRRGRVLLINPGLNSKDLGLWGLGGSGFGVAGVQSQVT